jgi:porin
LPLPALAAEPEESDTAPNSGGDFWTRPKLTGDWGGVRDKWAEAGLTLDIDATYIFQNVVSGGLRGRLFDRFSEEEDSGNTFSTDLKLGLDTEKAGLWEGGYFNLQLEGRAGRSVLQRAGSISAVNNDALFPNVVDDFDDETGAITDLSFTQYLSEKVAVYGGLLNNAEGDANDLAGSSLSNEHFLNSALLYSLVEDATVPNVSLGGGILFEPTDRVSGSFSVFGTAETAGENPFDDWHGTTFSTEWTVEHTLAEKDGAQTLGFLYGMDASRTDIAANPRIVLASVTNDRPIPTTESDTWSFYYNAHQYIQGDGNCGWGTFARFGISDGNPNVVKWNVAGGLGGVGPIPGRDHDRWGLGVFYLDVSDEDLLEGLRVGNEVGGEVFYNIVVTPWFHVTLDAQVIDSALPAGDTSWVLGLRTRIIF